jgi:S1-C subfamily serine protease
MSMGLRPPAMFRFGAVAALAAGVVAASAMLIGGAHPVQASPSAAAAVDTGVVDVDTTLAFNEGEAAGTGILLTSSGLVLTNNHVIRHAASIHVTDVRTGRRYAAAVVGYDVSADVAVLKLKSASGLKTASLGHSSSVRLNNRVTAVGNAGGVGGSPTVTNGRVSALHRAITVSDESGNYERLTGLIQSTASVQPGDSGGPLLDSHGRVIGIITASSGGFQFDATASGGFAVPIDTASRIAGQIRGHHASSTVHIGPTAFLGVFTRTTSYGRSYGGALIAGVVPGSAADKAGLVEGDVIVSFAGHSITSASALSAQVLRISPGTAVKVRWLDSYGGTHTATVRPAAGPPQ